MLVQENSANAELLSHGLMGGARPKGGSKRKAQAVVGRETQARKRSEHQVETCVFTVTIDTIQQEHSVNMQKRRHDEAMAAAEAKADAEWKPTTKDKRRAQQRIRRERCMTFSAVVFKPWCLDLRNREATNLPDELRTDEADDGTRTHATARQ